MDTQAELRELAESCEYASDPDDVDYEVDDSVDALISYKDGLEDMAGRWGGALERVNAVLSAPSWSVGMLEDIRAVLDSAGIAKLDNPPEYIHH